ncbi:GDSL-like Lipase/Acylhydrolase family protein [Microlunatus sagamiharensis]|uniref:GDSL-like Lipase/Acylhydrolase family protein n=1 Tax=Microlunatus sagamiharensis TaxID=546874 RepID=A0A1H2LKS8_9ACTN|nr:SGNH/GDSL hydrolase family protein [Microlunatus sagamiharensis]SDU81238.1 GDSL-like Lipase/Acylhydrolase family protein [Microlunatus sagamiharensis]
MRTPLRAVAGAASAAVLLSLAATPAHAASPGYVALGDSYASGVGTRSYVSDGTSCQRSVYGYPALVAGSRGYALNLRACSGATIADVSSLQLSALSTSTAYVSVTVGGNDAGFTDVLTTCALPAWASSCNGAVVRAQGIVANQVPGRLSTLFGQIRAKAPHARVVVAGYPRLFNGEDCNAFTWFSPTEETRLNATADQLDAVLSTAASRAGFTFANPAPAFAGHAVCDDAEWLNGLSSPTSESYHPNRTGHASGYAPLVGARLGGTSSASALRVTSATISAERLASQQRRYAAGDRAIRPETFRRPDLTSPTVERAARRAGVDLDSRTSIDRADRRYATAQAKAFRQR